jgi:hypothetical protein
MTPSSGSFLSVTCQYSDIGSTASRVATARIVHPSSPSASITAIAASTTVSLSSGSRPGVPTREILTNEPDARATPADRAGDKARLHETT